MKTGNRCILLLVIFLCLSAVSTASPAPPQEPPGGTQLAPAPHDPAVDPDYDRYISSWKNSPTTTLYGALREHAILTKNPGDPLHPRNKGEVLTDIISLSRAILPVGASSSEMQLTGEQHVWYIESGEGTVTSGGKSSRLHADIGVIIPPGVAFSIANSGSKVLSMYVIKEPLPEGFEPRREILVHEWNGMGEWNTTGHWVHITPGGVLGASDGFSVITGMSPVWYGPMTIGQPHSHNGAEEVWFLLEGDLSLLLGKKFYRLSPGEAYRIPPDGLTWHSNINATGTPLKMVWFMRQRRASPASPYAELNGRPYDDRTESHIDNFLSSWKHSMPKSSHGGLIERQVFTANEGDPARPTSAGAVLGTVKKFARVSLFAGKETLPTTLSGEQEIFYVVEGSGTIRGGGATYDLYPGVVVLVPESLEFTMANIGDGVLSAYLVTEPTRPGFKPRNSILWRDENELDFSATNAHWVERVKTLVGPGDGLARLDGCFTVTLPPDTFSQPHSHGPGEEVAWVAVDGDVTVFLGKQLRELPEGYGYLVPPDNATPHANMNVGKVPVKLFYFTSGIHGR